jgi:hypothetical protein
MWPPFVAWDTTAPGRLAIVRSPVGTIMLSRSLLVAVSFAFQLLTARTFPEPTRPPIQLPSAPPLPGTVQSPELLEWLVFFPSWCADPPNDAV